MESGWNFFTNSTNGTSGQNGHCSNLTWDVWELGTTGTSRFDWSTSTTTTNNNNNNNSFHEEEEEHAPPSTTQIAAAHTAASAFPDASAVHALMLSHHHHHNHHGSQTASLYAGSGTHYQPDPHLMCLNLGKRHYFEDTNPLVLGSDRDVGGFSIAKRGRPHYGGFGGGFGGVGGGGMELPPTNSVVTVASTAAVPRCQVEGCHVALVNVKEYHRRHKVCEMHSKAPKVVVLGLEQRFCQQCSRFHAVSEFDDSKRSCRRRLAGHNERRRKGSQESSVSRNPSQGGRVLSLLSSRNNSWFSSADLSSRCSAALRELIAENRAAILARQFVPDGDWLRHHHALEEASGATHPNSNSPVTSHHQTFPEPHNWERFSDDGGGHLTLDLMQAPSTEFGFLSVRGKSKEEEEEAACSELWSSMGGAHIV